MVLPSSSAAKACIGRQRRGAGRGRARDPGRRDLAADDALAVVGLEPIDARRFIRQALPDRQQQTGDDVDLAVGELRHVGELGLPGAREGLAVGLAPMGLRHHRQRDDRVLHRPDQPDAAFDLAVVEHDAAGRHLHGGAARLRVDQQHGARIGEMVQRLVERDRPVALALRDGEQPGFGRRCRDGCRSSAGR